MLNAIGIIAGILAFSSYAFYIASILRGETKPNRASWWIWAAMGMIILLSYYFSGARSTIWAPLSEALGPIIGAILSVKYGEGGWSPFDRKCLLGVAVILLLWWSFNSSLVALISALCVDLFAALPTIRKSYLRPGKESFSAWLLVVMANFLNIFAIEDWKFAIAIQPIYYTFITFSIFLPLLLSKLRISKVGPRFSRKILSDID